MRLLVYFQTTLFRQSILLEDLDSVKSLLKHHAINNQKHPASLSTAMRHVFVLAHLSIIVKDLQHPPTSAMWTDCSKLTSDEDE